MIGERSFTSVSSWILGGSPAHTRKSALLTPANHNIIHSLHSPFSRQQQDLVDDHDNNKTWSMNPRLLTFFSRILLTYFSSFLTVARALVTPPQHALQSAGNPYPLVWTCHIRIFQKNSHGHVICPRSSRENQTRATPTHDSRRCAKYVAQDECIRIKT